MAYNKAPYFPLDGIIYANIYQINELVFIGDNDLKYFT